MFEIENYVFFFNNIIFEIRTCVKDNRFGKGSRDDDGDEGFDKS